MASAAAFGFRASLACTLSMAVRLLNQDPRIESPAVPPVSREQAASEAEAAAAAQRQPVPGAAGAGSRRIPRPAPPESQGQPARGAPF
jgi:hypothetical protein